MKSLLSFLLLLLPICVFGAEYNIGPGQTYTTIASFPGWLTLQPGDKVRIHPGTYKEHILLANSGTEQNPIVIEGVLDGNGTRPIIDGDGAVIPTQFAGHMPSVLYQGYGVIYINRSVSRDAFGSYPQWITIKNLDIKSATPELYQFTDTSGVTKPYPGSSAAIYIKVGRNILIENCIMRDSGNGFDIQGVDAMVKNVTVRGCYIYGNGRTDARFDREHNAYTEGSGTVFEYNVFGRLRDGSGGIAIKDRGANTVIRYNIIYSGARTLDLVEPENQSSWNCEGTSYTPGKMHDEPNFGKDYVYGNVFINGPAGAYPTSSNMIHYGADNCPSIARKGTLHFYNNTVYLNLDTTKYFYTRIFDLTSNNEKIDLYNNVFLSVGNTNLYLANTAGTFNWLGGNWVKTGYNNRYTGSSAIWNEYFPILKGPASGVLTDPATGDFSILPGSPLIGAGVALPAGITTGYNVTQQYLGPRSFMARETVSDIGAFAYSGAPPVGDTTPPTCAPFAFAATSTSLTVPITTPISCTDANGVTGYVLSEVSNPPASGTLGSPTVPTSLAFGGVGTRSGYLYARDAAGNWSNVRSSSTTITEAVTPSGTGGAMLGIRGRSVISPNGRGWMSFGQ